MRNRILSYLSVLAIPLLLFQSCSKKSNKPIETPLTIYEDSLTGVAKAKEARENIAAQLADGLQLSLWASDSLAPDPIAIDIDDEGKIYLTRSNRHKNSEFDIRGEVANPPAPRALDLYPIEIRNNVLSVNTGILRKRSVFSPDQVTYPKKI